MKVIEGHSHKSQVYLKIKVGAQIKIFEYGRSLIMAQIERWRQA